MKLAVALTASLAASGTILGAQQVVTFSTGLEMKTMKGAPYSADTVNDTTQALADGNRISRHVTGRVYRDSEGRTRREEDVPASGPIGVVADGGRRAARGPSITITDPVAGTSYTLDTTNHIAYKTSGNVSLDIVTNASRRVEELKASVMTADGRGGGVYTTTDGRGDKGASSETLDPKMIEGVMAEGHRTTITIPAGSIGNEQPIVIVSEEWKSPDLGVLLLTDHKDPRTGETIYKLTNIVRGDPDASLFQVPGDYTIKESGVRRFDNR
jgi:hypothetical protein